MASFSIKTVERYLTHAGSKSDIIVGQRTTGNRIVLSLMPNGEDEQSDVNVYAIFREAFKAAVMSNKDFSFEVDQDAPPSVAWFKSDKLKKRIAVFCSEQYSHAMSRYVAEISDI